MSDNSLLFYHSKWANAFSAVFCFLISVGLSAGAMAILIRDNIQSDIGIALLFSIIALALAYCAFSFAKKIFDTEPSIILDEKGIFSRSTPFGLIPWSEIASVHISRSPRYNAIVIMDYLKLTLYTPERWIKRLPPYAQRIKKFTKSKTIAIQFCNTTPSIQKVDAYISRHISHTGSPSSRR